jgi:hypothetical protein
MQPVFVQIFFLLCATAVELHLALIAVTPARYLRFLTQTAPSQAQNAPSQAVSWRMRLLCGFLFCLILSIQHVGLERLLQR